MTGLSNHCPRRPPPGTRPPGGVAEVIHQVPEVGHSATPCCGVSPFDLPASDRITSNLDLVTCDRRQMPPRRAVLPPMATFNLENYYETVAARHREETAIIQLVAAIPGHDLHFTEVLHEVRHRQKLGMSKTAALQSVTADLTSGRWAR